MPSASESRSVATRRPRGSIGVVRDVKYRMLREPSGPSFYLPLGQQRARAGVIHVRVEGDPRAVLDTLRRTLAEVNPAVPITSVRTLREQANLNLNDERLAMIIGVTLGGAPRCSSPPSACTARSPTWWDSAPANSASAWRSARPQRRRPARPPPGRGPLDRRHGVWRRLRDADSNARGPPLRRPRGRLPRSSPPSSSWRRRARRQLAPRAPRRPRRSGQRAARGVDGRSQELRAIDPPCACPFPP